MSDCLFCRIVRGEIKAGIVYEDDAVLAFKDINPQAPVHYLVIPKKHITGVAGLAEADLALAGRCLAVCRDLARKEKIEDGYRVVSNSGADAGQSVFHLHFHLLGGRPMAWPPG
jgi:histidine triad (HIT) family protein